MWVGSGAIRLSSVAARFRPLPKACSVELAARFVHGLEEGWRRLGGNSPWFGVTTAGMALGGWRMRYT